MRKAALIVAAGILVGAVLIAPYLLMSVSYAASLLGLVAWIGFAPTLMRRREGQRTNAGWLGGLGLYSVTVVIGMVASLVALAISVMALPRAEAPDGPLVDADAAPRQVIESVLGIAMTPDLSVDPAGILVTSVTPGGWAEMMRIEAGHRILDANETSLGESRKDPLVTAALQAARRADSATKAQESLQLVLDRDRELYEIAERQVDDLRSRIQEAEFSIDSSALRGLRLEEQQRADSLLRTEQRLRTLESDLETGQVKADELEVRRRFAEQALDGSDYAEWKEREEEQMLARLARELKLLNDGEAVRLTMEMGDSVATFDLGTRGPIDFTYSPLSFAILLVGSALALGMLRLTGEATEAVATIQSRRAFESRHTVWQRELAAAAAAAPDAATRNQLASCAEAVQYAARDPNAEGTPVNADIDAIVASLCQTPTPSEAQLQELGGSLRAMLVRRENAIRSARTTQANTERVTNSFE